MKLSETEFQQTIIDLANALGWVVAHFRGVRVQRQDGSVYYQTPVQADGAGFPDLVLVKDYVIYAELKTDTGKVSEAQTKWINLLSKAGCDVYVWRPKQFEDIARILGG